MAGGSLAMLAAIRRADAKRKKAANFAGSRTNISPAVSRPKKKGHAI
jgi:hypothetical protein